MGCSPWGCKESDTTERLSTAYIPSPGDLPDPGIESGSPAMQQILYQLRHQGGLHKDNHCRRLYPLSSVSLITYLLAFSLLTFYSRAKPFEELKWLISMSSHSCIHLRRFLGALRNSWRKQKRWWTPEIYWGSSKEDIQMASRHRKRCSASLIIKETRMKTAMRYHLTPVRMAIIKKSTNNKS